MKAKKALGQHFLVQDSIAEDLSSALQLEGIKSIVEIGPGKGILTRFLLTHGLPVFALELDRDMIPILASAFQDPNLHVEQGDALKIDLMQLLGDKTPFVIVGNFPYNISSQIVFLALRYKHHVPYMAGMFQKEMAERICSPPGSKDFGVISVLTQAYYTPKMLFHVKPGSFSPPPKVMSAVISLERFREEIDGVSETSLRHVVKQSFSQRRKKLRNTLKSMVPEDIMRDLGVVDKRPEHIEVDLFIELAKNIQPT